MIRSILYFVAFQGGWFACVLGAAHGVAWLGVALVVVLLAVHLALAARPLQEFKLLLIAGAIGTLWDSLLVALGITHFASGTWFALMAPYWITALWILFAATLNVMLRWLRGRELTSIVLGGLGGPLAFYSGSRLGAVSFQSPWIALSLQALGWAVVTPLLVGLSQRFDGIAPDV